MGRAWGAEGSLHGARPTPLGAGPHKARERPTSLGGGSGGGGGGN